MSVWWRLSGASVLVVAGAAGIAVPAVAGGLQVTETWSVAIPDSSGPIVASSPTPADLGGTPAVLVGDISGRVYAFDQRTGAAVRGWPVQAGGPVDSTPSVDPDGSRVFVDTGDDATQQTGQGAYEAFGSDGTPLWQVVQPSEPGGDTAGAVSASPTVADLQGTTAVVAGTLGQQTDEITASGTVAGGFPWFSGDSVASTAAVADLYGNGGTEIVEGGDSSAGLAYNTTYHDGGHIRVVSQAGNTGADEANGGTLCDYDTGQIVRSSPAVGRVLAGGATGIVAGTGFYQPYAGASGTDAVVALDTSCRAVWSDTLDGTTTDSPALVDALGNGTLQVAEGTNIDDADRSGSVYLLDGATGRVDWQRDGLPAVLGGITSADLGNGHQDLLVPTGTDGVVILDGATGATLASLAPNVGVQDSPLVTVDADGLIGITVAALTTAGGAINGSVVEHFEVAGTAGIAATGPGAWPEFHHDPQLTGDAGTPPPVGTTCVPPALGPQGYWETGADGGVFTYGDLPYCGSTGDIRLARPVVGMAATPDGGGYWTVASDGGVFAFGDAGFYGSTGGVPLTAPVVGLVPTADARGYWLVASDGGVFAFGDAGYHGSTGAIHLASPVVGLARTPDGGGYWLVGADGGVFGFGDAHFYGSTGARHLARPVVALLPDTMTQGYWLVAADGGVFSFDAPFYGSTGGIHLARPVVAAQPVGYGAGYRFEASDGGVFDFGAAGFHGSAAGLALSAPVVGAAGY